jgi:formiminotetrahydrofolate cyclodeaminase
MMDETILEIPLHRLLEQMASAPLGPAGGSVAALAATMAASVVAHVARRSVDAWPQARGAAAQAEALRARGAPLAQLDADAYIHAVATLRAPPGKGGERRDFAIANALREAADIPLAIADFAADVSALAAEVARLGSADHRADALVAAVLAQAAARGAAHLVAINLSMSPEDERLRRARAAVALASAACEGLEGGEAGL